MVINQLRQYTQQSHKELDEWLLPKFQEIDSEKKYKDLLKAFYGYFMPVTEKIEEYLDIALLPDYHERRKPTAILNDLKALKEQHDEIAYAHRLPEINNTAQAFGALYVLEGSTLGGVFLSKMLARNIMVDEKRGLSFFTGYGNQSREKWDAFVNYLNAFAANSNASEITGAAVETFQCFKLHLQQQL